MSSPKSPPPFAELLAKSSFSFLEGASSPGELIATAKELGLAAIAVCDRDGLYGSARALVAAEEHGLPLVTGAELTLDPAVGPNPAQAVALLVEDLTGYQHLCSLLTDAHHGREKGTAGIALEQVCSRAEGLVAVVPLDAREGLSPPGKELWGPLRDAFGERLFAATFRHKDGHDRARTEAAKAAEERFMVPVVASTKPLYARPEGKPLADVLFCIRNKTTLDEADARASLPLNAEAYLRAPHRMMRLYLDQPEWVTRTADVAARCRFSLRDVRYAFPGEIACAPGEAPNAALRRLTAEGLVRRYGEDVPLAVRAQVDKELSIIEALDVAPYFLSVHFIVSIARRRRILCQGRGSAANSAVCFALGITAVDPARQDLLFERFLSKERHEPPDIDVDFEHERREEVIQEIYEVFGRDRAAMVSEVISYRGKSALREVGKVFGLGPDQVASLSNLLLHMDREGLSYDRLSEVGLDARDERLQQAMAIARALSGHPRHLSIHVGGFVLSSSSLASVAPVEPARMEGRTVIPWDKDDLDALGFFKVDVLGLGMLTAIRKALAMIEGRPSDPIEALASIPPEDPKVYEAIQRADTVGVFQIESRAQMSMLPRLKPKEFYDLVVEVAIVRPGPIQGGMVHPYLKRRAGKEAVTAPHPCLEPILKRTLGVPLFQEQVMQIAMVGAGYTPGEADQLRRDMAAWRRTGKLERHRSKLLKGFTERGISGAFGERLYQQIHGFGEYGFPESHAASFALLVYASAWLKVFYPAEFLAAILNSQPMGFYSPSSLVQDAQRHGVAVFAPCVVKSDWDTRLEGDGVRLGLRLIRGVGEASGQKLLAARRGGPFVSVDDLMVRSGLGRDVVEALGEAGALAALVPERREALWRARAPREGGLYKGRSIEPDRDVGLDPLPPLEALAMDYGRVGLSLHDHPMKHLRARLSERGVVTAERLHHKKNRSKVVVAGLVIGRQRPGTASGVTFFTLEDETGPVNVIVRADVFADNFVIAKTAPLLLVRGRVEREGDVVHVLALGMERIDLAQEEQMSFRSRDFH